MTSAYLLPILRIVFNYNHLYYFYVSAKLNGVTAAAKQLNTSQSSLSAQIKSLEASLEKNLFRKNGRNMELTDDGHQVYGYCKQMFEAAENLEGYLRGSGKSKRAKISIGVSTEIERPFIANIIGAAIKNSPQEARPIVSLSSENEVDLRRSLKFGKIDFIVSDSPVYDSDLEVEASFSMPVVFFIAPSLAKELEIKPKDSAVDALKKAAAHLSLPSNPTRLRQESDLYLQRKKLRFDLNFEADILSAIVRSVIDGVSASLMPLPYFLKEARLDLVKIVGPQEGLWQHKIHVITRKEQSSNKFLLNLLSVLEAEVKTHRRFNL